VKQILLRGQGFLDQAYPDYEVTTSKGDISKEL
jgi:hypothetical protein